MKKKDRIHRIHLQPKKHPTRFCCDRDTHSSISRTIGDFFQKNLAKEGKKEQPEKKRDKLGRRLAASHLARILRAHKICKPILKYLPQEQKIQE